MVMAVPILRIFILVTSVNQLLHSVISAMGPVALYGKLLLVIMYFYTVVSLPYQNQLHAYQFVLADRILCIQ